MAIAYLPYSQTTFGLLANYNIKSVALPPKKIGHFMPPVKEALGLRIPGYTVSPVSAERSTWDRAAGPSITYQGA